ncbi:ATP synthase subunit epsilon, mitochondrial isoform X2 [Elaeis guineensis]|uniref:ATP synthase subunit epsilon, mitochondrial n=1 Tax=Elaeis guineensis var. tenera TaxID=51953 RepID=A0A6I9QUP5_ELAGV|nr:ATP synthase subunit epsilon, mitochondrial [Elaeis guineensis]
MPSQSHHRGESFRERWGRRISFGGGELRSSVVMASAAAGSSAAVPFWRAAGMTYITYSNICASLVRSCLKEPYKTEAATREKVHFAISKWADGKPEKPTIRSDSPEE